MSKLSFAPIFSAAHVSKWDALPEDVCPRTTQPRFEPERRAQLSVDDDADREVCAPLESYRPHGSVFSMRECEITVQVASPVGDAVATTLRDGPRSCENMAIKTYTWITLWFLLTAPLIFWDATYCFMRPRSMVGGDLHWIWEPYGLYQDIDHVYGPQALEENNGFTNAQSLLNLVETALNLAYVYLAHVSSWQGAPLIGFTAATMTLSKTALYWAQEYYCNFCATGHNTWDTLLLLWVLPNGFWLVFPGMIVWRLGGDIVSSLSTASRSVHKIATGKTK